MEAKLIVYKYAIVSLVRINKWIVKACKSLFIKIYLTDV
jgi:hypothetical protein